jgi:hypothetical protein
MWHLRNVGISALHIAIKPRCFGRDDEVAEEKICDLTPGQSARRLGDTAVGQTASMPAKPVAVLKIK